MHLCTTSKANDGSQASDSFKPHYVASRSLPAPALGCSNTSPIFRRPIASRAIQLKESDPIWVLRSGFQGNYKDVRGFVSDHSRKDAKRVIAKRLMQDDSSFFGQEVNIKQKTKQRQGTILKVNPTKALVEVDEGQSRRQRRMRRARPRLLCRRQG